MTASIVSLSFTARPFSSTKTPTTPSTSRRCPPATPSFASGVRRASPSQRAAPCRSSRSRRRGRGSRGCSDAPSRGRRDARCSSRRGVQRGIRPALLRRDGIDLTDAGPRASRKHHFVVEFRVVGRRRGTCWAVTPIESRGLPPSDPLPLRPAFATGGAAASRRVCHCSSTNCGTATNNGPRAVDRVTRVWNRPVSVGRALATELPASIGAVVAYRITEN